MREYPEALYVGFSNVLDTVAKPLKMHDAYPLASLQSFLIASTIPELCSGDQRSSEALAIMLQICKT